MAIYAEESSLDRLLRLEKENKTLREQAHNRNLALRNKFAMAAMQGLIIRHGYDERDSVVVRDAYAYADLMMKESVK